VAHVIVDAMVDMPVIKQYAPDAPEAKLLDSTAAAETYWHLHCQPQRSMTFEVDLRPMAAQF